MKVAWRQFATHFVTALLVGLFFGAVGGAVGWVISRLTDPSGWSSLPDGVGGIIIGYGVGTGFGAYLSHRKLGGSKGFILALLSSLTGLFVVIFLSEPLHLKSVPVLMWGLLFFFPPFSAATSMVQSDLKEVR